MSHSSNFKFKSFNGRFLFVLYFQLPKYDYILKWNLRFTIDIAYIRAKLVLYYKVAKFSYIFIYKLCPVIWRK